MLVADNPVSCARNHSFSKKYTGGANNMADLEGLGTLLEADVLVIGGGLAGTNAAIAAAERNAKVVVMDKGKIERSGDIGGGVDHFLAYLDTDKSWDTKEHFLKYVWKIGRGTTEPRVLEKVYCDELTDAIERMERIGCPLTQPDGSFYRTASMGQPGTYWINFNGKRLKPCLGKEVRRLGCTVLDKVMATELLVKDGKVVGATGMHIRTGEFFIVNAKATIISTGSTQRLYESPRVNPFNTWLSPFDTGDGQAMAFKAGAKLANMEYMRMTMLPKGFAAPGFNAFTGMGGRFMNSLGEYYMEKNHPMGNKAPRYDVVYYSLKELKAGRGPLSIDCRHIKDEDLKHLNSTLGYDKDTLPDYMEQRGEDLKTKPFEIMPSEGMQCGPTEVTGSGVKIDENCAATVPGLFACGDACDAQRCVHGCITGGYAAGKGATKYAANAKLLEPEYDQVKSIKKAVYAPLEREDGISYTDFENIIRKVMTENVGSERTEGGLKVAAEKLQKIRSFLPELKADNYHELMRANESRNLLDVGEIMVQAALFRTESRNKPYHHRLDFPETDNENWCGQVLVSREGDNIMTEFLPIAFDDGGDN